VKSQFLHESRRTASFWHIRVDYEHGQACQAGLRVWLIKSTSSRAFDGLNESIILSKYEFQDPGIKFDKDALKGGAQARNKYHSASTQWSI